MMSGRYPHPNQAELPVEVNKAGTHLRHTKTKEFYRICHYQNKWSDQVEHKVGVNGEKIFAQVACECFNHCELGKLECDHFNKNRNDNSFFNLSGKTRSFQANNRKCQEARNDGTHCGVKRTDTHDEPCCWIASYQCYTPESITKSIRMMEYFYDHHYGGNSEK
jgi:hypothetical protein